MICNYRYALITLFSCCLLTTARGLELTFTNLTGLDDSEVFIYFDSSFSGTFNNGGLSFETEKSYSLATIGSGSSATSGVTLAGAGGRIFSTIGAPFPATTPTPQFINQPTGSFTQNNSFNNRHQLLGEITTGSVGNLSNIDWVTQPAAMRTFNSSGTQLERIGYADGYNSSNLRTKLNALTSGGAEFTSIANLSGNDPTQYSRSGTPTTAAQSPAIGSPVRTISPTNNSVLVADGKTSYPSFNSYIGSINTNNPSPSAANPIAKLEGQFFSGSTPDGKFYEAKITGLDLPSGGDPSYSLGQVTIEGTTYSSYDSGTNTFSGEVNTFTIVIPYESLTDVTIYGGTTGDENNATPSNQKGVGYNLSVNGGSSTPTNGGANTIYTLAVRDFFAGLNYGYIDSDTINPNDPMSNVMYKDSASAYWGTTNLLTGAIATNAPLYFADLQSDPFYNQWASVISEESNNSVYGFAYDDVFNNVQIALGAGVDRLDIVLLPDIYTVVPEPQTYALISGALLLIGTFYIRRRKS